MEMKKSDLNNLSRSEVIDIIMKMKEQPKPAPRLMTFKSTKPIPKPRKSVKQMAQEF